MNDGEIRAGGSPKARDRPESRNFDLIQAMNIESCCAISDGRGSFRPGTSYILPEIFIQFALNPELEELSRFSSFSYTVTLSF